MINGGRPLYQQQGDLSLVIESQAVEVVLRNLICPALGTQLTSDKLPISYQVDYALSDATQIKGFLEVKGRNVPYDRFPTWFLSLNKFLRGIQFASVCQCPFWLCYVWEKKVFVAQITRADVAFTAMGGNVKRSDGQGDWEPMVHFARSLFCYVGDLP